jgi:uncharacterized protein (DUF2249 family)
MNANTVTLDVRDEIRAGIEPFTKIMTAVKALEPGQNLRLLAPFKPLPLFSLLARRGFTHSEQLLNQGEWEVIFTRTQILEPGEPSAPLPAEARASAPVTNPVTVDARGLEPPQPLVTILEALTQLPAGARMRALTDRRPMHLYGKLTERGFVGESEEQPDGSFITHIRRA